MRETPATNPIFAFSARVFAALPDDAAVVAVAEPVLAVAVAVVFSPDAVVWVWAVTAGAEAEPEGFEPAADVGDELPPEANGPPAVVELVVDALSRRNIRLQYA